MKYKDVAGFSFRFQLSDSLRDQALRYDRTIERDERYRYLAGVTLQEGQV